MAAGVEVEQRQPQLLAAGHLIDEGITGFFQRFFHRMAEVNQVAVVRQDLPGAKVILFTGGFEFGDGLVAERRGAPLALVLVKRAKAVASISAARMAALASPPEALTCAPTYFIKTQLKPLGVGNDSGLTGERCSALCHQAVDRDVNGPAANNQPDEQHQRHQQRFRPGFFSALT